VTALALIAATVASYAVGSLLGMPVLLPILNAAASYPFMIAALRRGDLRSAVGRMLVWAVALGVCATLLSYAFPQRTDTLFAHGAAYRAEMFAWVRTGRGAESTPSVFIPQQALHAALFALLAIATASAAAMPMGAALMNYMGHYVGTLAAAGAHPLLLLILGWHPWAIIRVASFVVIGVVLALPAGSRVFRLAVDWRAARRLLAWAIAGLVVDAALKALLAPAWQRLLLRLTGW